MLPFSQVFALGVNNAAVAAAPSIAFRAGYSSATNASSYTFASCDFGAEPGAAETREVFISIEWYQGAAATRTLSSVTIGGVAAALETPYASGVLQAMCVARAVVPTGVSGDVVVTFSNTVTSCSIATYRVMNRPGVGTGASDSGSVSATTTTTGGIAGIDVPAGGFVLSVAGWNNTISAPALSGLTGAASDVFNTPESTGYAAHGSTPLQASASTGNTLTWTWTTTRTGFMAAWAF